VEKKLYRGSGRSSMRLIPSKTGFVARVESRTAGKKKGRRDETLSRGPGLSVTESGGEVRVGYS